MHLFTILLLNLGFAFLTTSHPGEHETRSEPNNLLQKRAYHSNVVRGYSACAKNLELSGFNERADLRRRNKVDQHRRDFASRHQQQVLGPHPNNPNDTPNPHISTLPDQLRKYHLITDPKIDLDTPEHELFADNGTCVLNPDGTIGPFWVKGELIRSDITDGQPGIPMTIDTQLIDVETCEPLEGVWWDIWACNATGVYSGVQERGNGDKDDTSNLKATFMRGLQQTDSEGVAQFQTIFPGHYMHRATHLHVVAHVGNVTRLSNDTIVGGTVAHVGQLFWDQGLIDEVEKTFPYNTNTIPITPNGRDRLFLDEVEDTTSDPLFNYVKLGDSIEDGIFAWISIAINTSASFDPSYHWRLTDHGDVPGSGGDGHF